MAKMLRLVCALAFGFWLVGCDNIKTQKVYWDDGKTLKAEYSYVTDKNWGIALTICDNIDAIPKARLRGPYKCYYENGAIREEQEFADNGKGGWMNVGVERHYYKNGQIRSEDNYNSKGRRDGTYKSWYENGQLSYEEQYKNNQKNGIAKSYYKNGILKREAQYKNHKQDGYEREYDKNGVLIREKFYKEGKEIKQ